MKRIKYMIETFMGKEEVEGYEVVPGLAVHRHDTWWSVTHVRSGFGAWSSSRGSFASRKQAVRYVNLLVKEFPGVKWTWAVSTVTREMQKVAGGRSQAGEVTRDLYDKACGHEVPK